MMHTTECWIPLQEVQLQEKTVAGFFLNIFVVDLFETGVTEMEQRVLASLRKDFQAGSEDWNAVAFTGQRIRWTQDPKTGSYMEVSHQKAIDDMKDTP